MAKHSKDLEDEVAILNELLALETEKDIRAFIKGEERESVLDAARERINEIIKPKQGEQSGPLTRETRDFKGSGVEGAKSPSPARGEGQGEGGAPLTGTDTVEAIDKADRKKAEDAERSALEFAAANPRLGHQNPKGVITGEDVIKKMRAAGKKI